MASSPPGACCVQTNFHEGTPLGTHKEIFGLDTYTVGESSKVIVILTDIYGHKYNNVLLVADAISKEGYKVLIPDILKGDPIVSFDELQAWLPKHTPEITAPIVNGFLKKVKEELKPTFLGSIGYCYGAKYVIQNLSSSGFWMLEQLHIHRLSLLKKLKKLNVHSLFLLLKLIQFSHLN